MPFATTEQALQYAYKLLALNIEPKGNTLSVLEHLQGIIGKGQGLTQHEHHANAVMIIRRAESKLNHIECAVIRCQYSADLSGIIDLTAYIEQRNCGINLLICDNLLTNIFIGRPRLVDIQDRYDLSKATLWRYKRMLRQSIAQIEQLAMMKIDEELRLHHIVADT